MKLEKIVFRTCIRQPGYEIIVLTSTTQVECICRAMDVLVTFE